MTGYGHDCLEGLAGRLAAAGIITRSATGYISEPPATAPAWYFGRLESDFDTAVAGAVYDENYDRDRWNPDVFVQLRFRVPGADPFAVDDLAARFFDVLDWDDNHDAETWPNGARILLAKRVMMTPPMPDDNGRVERFDSYRFTMNPRG